MVKKGSEIKGILLIYEYIQYGLSRFHIQRYAVNSLYFIQIPFFLPLCLPHFLPSYKPAD